MTPLVIDMHSMGSHFVLFETMEWCYHATLLLPRRQFPPLSEGCRPAWMKGALHE